MCGRPAVPSISASPSEIASIGSVTRRPGLRTPSPYSRLASAKSASGLNAEARQHQSGQERRTGQQQHRLDDLHPGGRNHPAEEHVDQHHAADDRDGQLVRQAEEQPNQVAGAYHLRDQVERDHGQRADRGGDAHRHLLQPRGHHVREGVAAEVPQRLGDEEHHDRPAHQPADRVDQPVEAGKRHQPRDAQEAGRAHVVAGQRQPVLQRGDAAAGGVELLGRLHLPRGPHGDAERQHDEPEEEPDRDGVRLAQAGVHRRSPARAAS